jgi:hypothetical protein
MASYVDIGKIIAVVAAKGPRGLFLFFASKSS